MTIQERLQRLPGLLRIARNDIADICHPQRRRRSVIAIRYRRRSSPRSAGCWIGRPCSFGSRMRMAMSVGARSGRIFRRPAPNTGHDWSTRCWRRRYRDLPQPAPGCVRDADASTSVLALQSGEPGPFAQAIAGIDLAVWDLYARRRNVALWKLLGGNPQSESGSMPAASIRLARGRWRRRRCAGGIAR